MARAEAAYALKLATPPLDERSKHLRRLVVRALEGAMQAGGGELRAGEGRTSLRIDGRFGPRIVDGLLTGVHQPGESHFELLQAFAPEHLLRRALAHAEREGYLAHEFGDSCLILPRSL